MTDNPLAKDHPLKLFNSLTRKVEQFVPADPSRVTMYNCGPTVYSYAHIGNARAAVVADVLFRVLRHIYGEEAVVYARNITDVDDKIIKAASEHGVDISVITEKYARIYNEDLAALNCLPPTVQPKATEHIQQMADIIVTLLDKDAAYEADGHVYFDVTKDDDYGKLSGRKLEDNRAGARVEVASVKRNPADFVLWKPARDGEPGWSQQESSTTYRVDWRSYGNRAFANTPGRPGWHIECSAMAKETLGETIDIHCGGIDLKFPHHENEIAQSETANGKEFARFWVHNEFLNIGREKMSKSLGNVTLVHDLLEEWDGEVIRLALLKAHYRSELSWSEDLLRESKANLDSVYNVMKRLASFGATPSRLSDTDNFVYHLRLGAFTDLKIKKQLGFLENGGRLISGELNLLQSELAEASDERTDELISDYRYTFSRYLAKLEFLRDLLGLLQRDPEDWFRGNASADDTARFDALAEARAAARAAKDWAEADRIRDEGKAAGIVFEDGADGTTWRKA